MPELLALKDPGVVLRGSDKIQFSYDKLNSDIYIGQKSLNQREPLLETTFV